MIDIHRRILLAAALGSFPATGPLEAQDRPSPAAKRPDTPAWPGKEQVVQASAGFVAGVRLAVRGARG